MIISGRYPERMLHGLAPANITVTLSQEEMEERHLKAVLVPWAAHMFGKFKLVAALYEDDRVALLLTMVCLESQKKLWRCGETITERDMDRCLALASQVVLDVLFPGGLPGFGVIPLVAAVGNWTPYMEVARERSRVGIDDERGYVIDRMTTEIWSHYGPPRDREQFFRVLRAQVRNTKVFEDSRPPDSVLSEVLRHYKIFTGGAPGGLYRAANGDIHLSQTDLRDFLCRRLAGRRHRKKARVGEAANHPSPTPTIEAHETPEDIADPSPSTAEVVGTADALRRVREVITARKKRFDRDSVKGKTLRYVIPYLSGEFSAPMIAAEIGASPSAVHGALVEHKQAILDAVKIS